MKKVLVALALSAVAFGASAAQLITKEEASHFKLTHVGSISVKCEASSLVINCAAEAPKATAERAKATNTFFILHSPWRRAILFTF
jgi:hypothetical protein